MYEAICAGDEETLAQCLGRATIETVLQFEACKKVSPLHLCLDVVGRNRFALIRRLLASGLVDATQCDSGGLTVLVRAHEIGDHELDFDRLSLATGDEKAAIRSKLIKDIQAKIKQLNKSAAKAGNADFKQPKSPEDGTKKLKAEICTRVPYMATPENVANKLLADLKKGKSLELAVAEVIAGEVIDLKHLVRGKDRAIIRRVKKCYAKTKQLYSLMKIMVYWQQMHPPGGHDRVVFTDSFKRILQVIGESVKNTQNSPNMPGKVARVLPSMLTMLFSTFNMALRETFSHSITLARTLMSEAIECRVFMIVSHYSDLVRVMFYLLFTVAVEDARFTLYGMMLRCWSTKQLRSLIVYVGTMENVAKDQRVCYQDVKSHFDKMKTLLDDTRELPVGATVRNASFASKDLRTVRRLLDWILTVRSPLKFFDRVSALWKTSCMELSSIIPNDVRLESLYASTVPAILSVYLGSIKAVEELDYLKHTRELAQKLGVAVDEDEEKVQKLHKMLERYYRNIFALDQKRKILEDFFDVKKSNKKAQDGKAAAIDQLIKEDQERLQTLFDERRSRLRAVLSQNGLVSVDSLNDWTPSNRGMLEAIDYLQLELTEILTTVGYFGNSFYYVMHRIPIIQGKNYRNYLAHDGISYDILSDTSMEIKVINAYVIANTDIRLFDRRSIPIGEAMRFPSVEDTHRWVAEQDHLMAAFQSRNVGMMHAAIRAGGELRSHFCCTPNHHYPSKYQPLKMLCNPCYPGPLIIELFNRYYNNFSDEIKDPFYVVQMALARNDCEEAFQRMLQLRDIEQVFTEMLQSEGFWHEIFQWDEFIPRLRGTKLFQRIICDEFKYEALRQFIESGNERSVREMLPFFTGDLRSDKTMDPLNDAIYCGVWSIAKLLLAKVSSPSFMSLQGAIITHAPMEFVCSLLAKSNLSAGDFYCMLTSSVRAKNQAAFLLLLEQQNLLQYLPGSLDECYELAAITPGQHRILQHLLENCPPANSNGLARILHQVARKQHWKSVRLLIEAGVSTDVFYPTPEGDNTTFLVLVRLGQTRLLKFVKAVDRVMYTRTKNHPLALAVRHGQDTKRMVRLLNRLGFVQSFEQTLTELDMDRLKRSPSVIDKEDHLSVALTVLPHWKTIAYVEQLVSGRTALLSALDLKTKPKHSHHYAKESETIKISKERLKYLSCLADVESKADEIDWLKTSITRMEKREKEKLEDFTVTWQKRSQNSRMGRRINHQLMLVTERIQHRSCLDVSDLQEEYEKLNGFVKRLQNRKEIRLNDEKQRLKIYFQHLRKGVLKSISFQKQRLKQLLCPEHTSTKNQEIDILKASLRKLERCEEELRYDLVSTLLERSQKSRMIEGLGVLGNIVFENDSKIIQLDKEDQNQATYGDTWCDYMITIMESLLPLKHCDSWREVTVNMGVSVTFRVLGITDEEFPPSLDGAYKLSEAASLLDTFIKLRDICREVFPSYDVICAHVVTTDAMIYYWQIEQLSYAFDVRPPGTTFHLADIINTRGCSGLTALHICLSHSSATKPQELMFQHRLAKLLLDHGANPLLANDDNDVALNWALFYPNHPAIAHDAIDRCLRHEQRNEQGKTMLELTPRMQEGLINNAVLNGRSDIVERLLGLGVDVSVQNAVGRTPAHNAILNPMHTSYRMLKQLLDYDHSLLYKKDAIGRTILHCAAVVESAEMMDLIRSYDPNLPEPPTGDAFYAGIMSDNWEFAEALTEMKNADRSEN
ncbi:AGAP010934-PA-like protein [Anopheles sinensis]|uniref:AGAP010934-PA-like protein n=1 Tax=Anopheles sinensis TaxID=74873 RepID=A0A084WS67_ANOSI|nr:AGAP010934-PA-like protein [Anopheles sinensis]